jgi:hypothetical protein
VADCGGLIGLFLGFSLLSVFEIFYRSMNMCSRVAKKRVEDESCAMEMAKQSNLKF